MARLVEKCGIYSVYELSERECASHFREFPTFVAWLSSHHDEIGNMNATENETETIDQMRQWCKEYS